ncbi:hypothetical protein QMP26_05435 [Enterocloster clostridioformis]|uniref:cobaltochelatase CobT-related protein n=1 Tax=Enterocloster clostridioformis TaxID=1531 RepID=UPI0026767325|nr:hypothetical protein [Enterocloster clostridioformis]
MSEKDYDRLKIQKIKNKISNKQVFTSKLFVRNMEKLANSLVWETGKKLKVSMGWNTSLSAAIAFTGGKSVYINAANPITRSFPTKELKTDSLVGFLGHECGHQKYTALYLRKLYGKGFEEGKIYPRPPVPGNEKEREALEEIKQFLQAGDKAAVSVIADTALRINNTLEDIYVEMRMCDEYPGSIRRGILMNANRHIEKLPTVTQEIQRQDHGLAIVLNLILGYARAGEINNWEGYDGEYLDCLYDCMELIDDAVVDVDKVERFRAANQLILKIWDYMKDLIQRIQEQEASNEPEKGAGPDHQEGPCSEDSFNNEEDTGGENGACGQNSSDNEEDILESVFSNVAAPAPDLEEECEETGDLPEGWDGTWEDEEEHAGEEKKDDQDDEKKEEPDVEGSGTEQEPSETLEGTTEEDSIPQEESEEENLLRVVLQIFRNNFRPEVTDQEDDRFKGESVCEETKGETLVKWDNDYEGSGYFNAVEDMNRVLYDLAEEKFEKEQEKILVNAIKSQAEHMDFGYAHADCNIEIHRLEKVPAPCIKMYDSLSPDILKTAKRLKEEMWEIIYPERDGMEKNLPMGRKIDSSRLYRQDKKIFMSRRAVGEERQAAIAVLIDESLSMEYEDRITFGRLTALILYDVCVNLGIPVIVYGHSTSYDDLYTEETVDLYAYAEFDSVDGKDRYRIMDMSSRGSNRDGAAIRFVAERLKTRPEDLKMLFLVSDGQPAALNYSGDLAKQDLKALKGDLKRQGILLFAAAIGDDREVIEDIYQDGFINISDLSRLPLSITKKILSYIR